MAVIRESVELAAPQAAVWELLTDWPRQGEWILGTTAKTVGGDATGVGGRIEGWTGLGPLGIRDPMEIRVWEPPRLVVMRHLGPWLRGSGAFELREAGAGRCVFTWSEWLEPPLGPVGRAGWRLAAPVSRMVTRLCLRRLAALVERGRA